MNPRTYFANRLCWLLSLAVMAALATLLWPVAAQAQEKQFALRFSSKSGDTALRVAAAAPNIAQDFFIYVDNLNAQNGMVKVEIRAGGKAIDGGAATVPLANTDKFKQASFGKPPEKAPPVAPGAAPPPPAAPAFAELKGPLTVVLLDMTNKVIDEVPLSIAHPKEYLEQPKITFNPKPGGELKNQLRVELKAKTDTFAGPPCRVDLVLDPHRIPGLTGTTKSGTRGGFLVAPGAELVLTADNLEFKDNKEQNGFVYLKVDGWERAFTFSTSFPREGTESTPDRVNTPIVRLLAPQLWNPAEPLPVKVEADNLDQQVVELSFDRDNDGKFSKLNGEIFDFPGDRQQRMLFDPTYPGGAFHLKPEVKDWSAAFDVAEVFGPRTLRVRLLKNATEAAKPNDADRAIDLNLNKAFGGTEPVKELRQVVLLDANPPSGIKFILDKMPKQLKVGDSLPVSASCTDPATIKQVVFFVGKIAPDGKIVPANAVQVPGELTDKEKGIWSADLDAPTAKKGKFDVTVQFVKTTGVVATDTIKIELIDNNNKPMGGGGKASIEGKIKDVGGTPQGAGVPVELRDDKGNVKDTTKTDEKSHYIFKDLIPGTYQIVSVRTATRTKGSIIVQVKDGEKKTDVDVGLSR